MLSEGFLDAQNRLSYIQKIYDFLHTPVERDEGRKPLVVTEGRISFHDVRFSYEEETAKPLINNFNLTIHSKEQIALVGKSGGGKTTLGLMMIGFYKPQEGYLEVDGQRLDACSLKSVRKNIGLIQQDVLLFDGSIKDNLLLGQRNATAVEIENACRQAGIWEFLISLAHGLETIVGTKGIRLSGEQKQRISIARIYLKNPPIIIFDEATSALDKETEEQIHSEWKKVLDGRTTIMIAHCKSTVLLCERAAMIEDGKMVLSGSPNDLIKSNEKFRTLFAVKSERNENE